jgi:positive regulator of sigma E activity
VLFKNYECPGATLNVSGCHGDSSMESGSQSSLKKTAAVVNGVNPHSRLSDVFFIYILPLLPVLALKKSRATLRCQIKRLKKTDPEEPYRE